MCIEKTRSGIAAFSQYFHLDITARPPSVLFQRSRLRFAQRNGVGQLLFLLDPEPFHAVFFRPLRRFGRHPHLHLFPAAAGAAQVTQVHCGLGFVNVAE